MQLKYIKLVILKIIFILGFCNFKFSFKIPWPLRPTPTKTKISDPPANSFLKIFTPRSPPPHSPKLERWGACIEIYNGKRKFFKTVCDQMEYFEQKAISLNLWAHLFVKLSRIYDWPRPILKIESAHMA